jgi:outer membrane murein-binding lipoprotein Lpp
MPRYPERFVETNETRGPSARHLDVAGAHADLGLPVPSGTRFRFVKRALGRLMWAFGRDQSLYNHAMLEAVGELASSVEILRTAIPEQVGNEVGSMRSEVGAVDVEVRRVAGQLTELADQLEQLSRRVDELARSVADAEMRAASREAGAAAPTG